MRWSAMAGAIGAVLAATLPALAETPEPSTKPPMLSVRAAPLFGSEAAIGDGWSEVAVNLDNPGSTAKKGSIELVTALPWNRDQAFTTRAPFNVPPARSVVVKLPTRGFGYQAPTMTLTVKDEAGAKITSVNVPTNGAANPLLVDVDNPSRLSVVMRNWPIPTLYAPSAYSGSGGSVRSMLTVGSATIDRATGDPILPDRAAGYAAVTVLLLHSDALAKLDAVALDAIVSWVLSGGTVAIIPSRPEDLRSPTMASLVGGAVTVTPPPPVLMSLPSTAKPAPPGLFPADPLEEPATPFDDPDHGGSPLKFEEERGASPFIPIRTGTQRWPKLGPTSDVRARLAGYAGGNLVPSIFGASAPYGLGEVHLLAFDPSATPMLDDPWVQARIVDLVAHAWDRRSTLVMQNGGAERTNLDDVRRALDPNENFRPALGIAAILLVLYSIVAGPLTFMRAAKTQKPLSPLKWAPIWSAVTFGVIVLVGFAGKGWRGRARHLSMVEAGAGMSRGSITRFRGFFTSETRSLTVASTDRSSVLQLATTDSIVHDLSALRLDRNGVTLENISSLPWQTVVVREDGFADLKGGISVIPTSDGSVDVVNHTGAALKDVLVYAPKEGVHYFGTVKDGEKIHGADGRSVMSAVTRPTSTAGSVTVHPFGSSVLAAGLGGPAADELVRVWQPLESATGDSVDWWPDTTPAVIGEMEGGEHTLRDSGLVVEHDRLLFRIVGRGGAL
jgi:hypothetical protein